jgi:hypothetical protein
LVRPKVLVDVTAKYFEAQDLLGQTIGFWKAARCADSGRRHLGRPILGALCIRPYPSPAKRAVPQRKVGAGWRNTSRRSAGMIEALLARIDD